MKPHHQVIISSVSKEHNTFIFKGLEPRDLHGLEDEGTMTE
jgi:hypothetical protein